MNKRENENERPVRDPLSLSGCAMMFLLATVGCDTTLTVVTRGSKSFSEVESVKLGTPSKEGSTVVVPLIFGREWTVEKPSRIRSTIVGTEIEITVITSARGECESVLILPERTKGEFKVFYRDPGKGGKHLTRYDGERHEIGVLIIDDD